MYIAEKGFSGAISAYKGKIIDIKNSKIAKELLQVGYIKEYTDKMKNNTELLKDNSVLKKENEDLKSEIEIIKKENEDLKSQLEEATKKI